MTKGSYVLCFCGSFSVRENILFGLPFDKADYEDCVQVGAVGLSFF